MREDMSIEYLDLLVPTYNALKRAGINFVSEIKDKTDEELLKIRNISDKRLKEIREKITVK
jgi:DNA-directed RNA polymerase subunit alpha